MPGNNAGRNKGEIMKTQIRTVKGNVAVASLDDAGVITMTVGAQTLVLETFNPYSTEPCDTPSGKVDAHVGRVKQGLVAFVADVENTAALKNLYMAQKQAKTDALERKIPGLAALRAIINTESFEAERAARDIDSGASIFKARTVSGSDVDVAQAEWPIASVYLQAEAFEGASNSAKAEAGRMAKKALLDGGSVEQAKALMQNWLSSVYID
jgi:hypothetical protein